MNLVELGFLEAHDRGVATAKQSFWTLLVDAIVIDIFFTRFAYPFFLFGNFLAVITTGSPRAVSLAVDEQNKMVAERVTLEDSGGPLTTLKRLADLQIFFWALRFRKLPGKDADRVVNQVANGIALRAWVDWSCLMATAFVFAALTTNYAPVVGNILNIILLTFYILIFAVPVLFVLIQIFRK
jgi:hypothetical protein